MKFKSTYGDRALLLWWYQGQKIFGTEKRVNGLMMVLCFKFASCWSSGSAEKYSIYCFNEIKVKWTEATLRILFWVYGLQDLGKWLGRGHQEICCWKLGDLPSKVREVNGQNSAWNTQVGGFQMLAWEPFWNSHSITYILSEKFRKLHNVWKFLQIVNHEVL